MRKTAQKEGLTGSKDTRTYFNAVIEEMHQSQMIQTCSPLKTRFFVLLSDLLSESMFPIFYFEKSRLL